MKILTLALLLALSFSAFAQDTVTGRYRDNFGNRIQLYTNNTFKYTWHFDLLASWTQGTWELKNDTVYFEMIPVYDTLSYTNESSIISDSLVLSTDEVPERLTQIQNTVLLLSGRQNQTGYPDKLLFKKGRLYKIQNRRRIVKKQKGFWTNKKWDPWYFKTED